MAKKDGNLKELMIPTLTHPWLKASFKMNRVSIFNCLIFKELIKSISSCIEAKEVVSDMLDAYEEACAEDIALEAAMTVFSRKKQLAYVKDKQIKTVDEKKAQTVRNLLGSGEDYFGHIADTSKSATKPTLGSNMTSMLGLATKPNISLNMAKSRDRYSS